MFRFRIRFLLTLVAVLLFAGPVLTFAQDDEPLRTTSPVQLFADASEVEDAWSTLTRYENGVAMTVHTAGLTPGNVYTVWWVVFNEPSMCTDGACGEDDIFLFDEAGEMVMGEAGPESNMEQIEAAQISVLGATGTIVGDDGELHLSSWLVGAGDAPGVLFGPALTNPEDAEIHLVVRDHGPMDPELLDEQILTFGGGCAPEWPNEPCQDVQFSVHQPAEM